MPTSRFRQIRDSAGLFLWSAGLLLRLAARSLGPRQWRRGRPWRRAAVLAAFVPLFLLLQLVHWVALTLDELFFPSYRRTPVPGPLFVVGVPRSGTTYLHRVLSEDEEQFTTLRTWELLLAPSIVQKKLCLLVGAADRWLGCPLRRALGRLERHGLGGMEGIHRLSLAEPEEDFLTLMPVMACFALVVVFPFSGDIWRLSRFDLALSDARRRKLMDFYKACLQRHLYVFGEGRRLLSKNVSFSPLIRTLSHCFPGARFVGCWRHPSAVAPSQLSSLAPSMALFGHDPADPGFKRRVLRMLKFYYRHLDTAFRRGRGEQWRMIRMEQIQGNLEGTVRGIYRQFGFELSSRFAGRLTHRHREARRYRSEHRYTPEQFGWGAEQLAREFSGVGYSQVRGAAAADAQR